MMSRLQSLRGLTIAFLALFLTVTAAAGLGTFFATLSMIVHLVDQRIEAESHALAPDGERIAVAELRQRIALATSARDTGDLGILLADAQGRRIAGNVAFTRVPPMGWSSLGLHDRIEGLSAGRILVRDIGDGMRLAVFAETEPIDHYFAVRRRIYIAGFGAIVIVVLGGLLLFRRLIGERIEQMRVTAELIVEGDLSRRVPIAGDGGEFDRQAAAFNHMLDRITQLMAEIRNVTNNVSHELRTPLARLRNRLAMMQAQGDAGPLQDDIQAALQQADALLAMFAALLRIAEIEGGARRAGFQPVEIAALAHEMAEMVQPLVQENCQTLSVGPCEAATLTGDRQLLSQMILNLVENAIRHCPAGTRIGVALSRSTEGDIILSVTDDGPGISAQDRALVMRRFGRTNSARSRSGHGLGLPLADAIARLHHGNLTLEDAAPGLRVVVRLPG